MESNTICSICFLPGTEKNPLVEIKLYLGAIQNIHEGCRSFKRIEALNLLEQVKQQYRNVGYDIEKDFPGEYYFMFNSTTVQKVRLYYRTGQVKEYK